MSAGCHRFVAGSVPELISSTRQRVRFVAENFRGNLCHAVPGSALPAGRFYLPTANAHACDAGARSAHTRTARQAAITVETNILRSLASFVSVCIATNWRSPVLA